MRCSASRYVAKVLFALVTSIGTASLPVHAAKTQPGTHTGTLQGAQYRIDIPAHRSAFGLTIGPGCLLRPFARIQSGVLHQFAQHDQWQRHVLGSARMAPGGQRARRVIGQVVEQMLHRGDRDVGGRAVRKQGKNRVHARAQELQPRLCWQASQDGHDPVLDPFDGLFESRAVEPVAFQDLPDVDAAWVHAYLHRVEGDLWNAGYWYRQAGRPECRSSLEDEWRAIAQTLLAAESGAKP